MKAGVIQNACHLSCTVVFTTCRTHDENANSNMHLLWSSFRCLCHVSLHGLMIASLTCFVPFGSVLSLNTAAGQTFVHLFICCRSDVHDSIYLLPGVVSEHRGCKGVVRICVALNAAHLTQYLCLGRGVIDHEPHEAPMA